MIQSDRRAEDGAGEEEQEWKGGGGGGEGGNRFSGAHSGEENQAGIGELVAGGTRGEACHLTPGF